jgi:NarL family two-component system sensor histidine kinase LiaS
MANKDFPSKRKRGLRWKFTMSYTVVTVGALLFVEMILIISASALIFVLVNNGTLPARLIESASVGFAPILRVYLSQSPPDREGLAALLEEWETTTASIPFTFDATDRLFIVGPEGQLLAAQPADIFGAGQIGRTLDTQVISGMAEPLQAALAGEDDPMKLFALDSFGEQVVLIIPIWDADHEQVLGVLGGLADYPTITSVFGDSLPILGISLLILTLIAGLAGTLFGFLAARDPVRRLNRLVEVAQAWSQGDFNAYVDDPESDELGRLAQQLNHMARELEQLLEARKELAVVEERNRLARDLHDSAKQQAFAAAAQISGIRALISRDPAAAEAHLIKTEHIIDQLRQELTSLIFELRPAMLDDRGLASAVNHYAVEWSRQTGIAAEVHLANERHLPIAIEKALFRVVQEALANVARHSKAGKVEMDLRFDSEDLILTLSDDGQGFEPKSAHIGFGLRSMKQRVESLGGNFTVDTIPGRGTTLIFRIPIPESSRKDQE